ISYRAYQGEQDLDVIVRLVDDELSEPYNLYTYRYFLDDWCVELSQAYAGEIPIGVIVCKQEPHPKSSKSVPIPDRPGERRPLMRGYLAMLSTRKEYRGRGVGELFLRMSASWRCEPVDEIVLETEADNTAALAFYAKMGFVREKRLHRFYLNGKDAYRLR
ncbi:acyl-CoA N-acyltransferase, partial [Rhodotorula sp. JG-1b]